jgi:Helix-turn-helix domain
VSRKSPRPSKASNPGRGNPDTPHATRARYTAHVVRHTRATPAQLADYLAGFRARGQGAWPSQKHLAVRFGVCVRTIQRWLRDLLEAGLVRVTKSKPYQDLLTGRWRRKTNQYRCRFKTRQPSTREKTRSDLGDIHVASTSLHGELVPVTPPVSQAPPCSPPAAPPFKPGETGAQWAMRMMGRL